MFDLNPYTDLPHVAAPSGHVLHLPANDPRVYAFITLDTGLSPVAFIDSAGVDYAVFDDGEWFVLDVDLSVVA